MLIFATFLIIFRKFCGLRLVKNKDNECFIYCYVRKFLNNVDKNHPDRASSKDKEIANKLEEELNFDNVKFKDLNKIEDLLDKNIYVYTCNQNLKHRTPIYKSDKNYEEYLDLLLFENHYMNIINICRFFSRNDNNKKYYVKIVVILCFHRKNIMNTNNCVK